jgi:hypothetical protein
MIPNFRLYHDNRRQIIEPEGFKAHDMSEKLLDSKHLLNQNQASKLRFLSKFPYTLAYNKKKTPLEWAQLTNLT